MPKTVAIVGALDTKGEDFAFLKAEIERLGCATLVVDFSVVGTPGFEPDVPAAQVATAAGAQLAVLASQGDRGAAMETMAAGVTAVLRQLHAAERIHGVIAMGGGGGTSVAAAAMRPLPIGFPKLIVSTVAGGDVSGFVGLSDIVMMPSVLDVSGVNRVTRVIYTNAAAAICGMVNGAVPASASRPAIAVSMFGNTTRAVQHARKVLEAAGYEVLVFHATGTGGRQMEALIAAGLVEGVLDMTTTEWADEVCGGVLSAGPNRLEAACQRGTPQVVVPGCLDMCNFWGPETLPPKYADRLFYHWNANVTLMRTTPAENRQLGEIFASRLNAAVGPVEVFIPLGGWSELDVPGKPFFLPEANEAFIAALKANLKASVPVVELPQDINDAAFAQAAAQALLALMQRKPADEGRNT
jgi:uncharacterized protein (UPF0261 family)